MRFSNRIIYTLNLIIQLDVSLSSPLNIQFSHESANIGNNVEYCLKFTKPQTHSVWVNRRQYG